MPIASRSATTTWAGALATGTGTFSATSSGVLDDQQVTWGSRTSAPAGKSSPEELLAAAHASCFAMALNVCLEENGTPNTSTDVTSEITFDEVDGKPTVTTSVITVRARVEGIDAATFATVANNAAALCPVSRALAGVEITVDAQLVEA